MKTHDLPEELIKKMSEDTGLSPEELTSKKEFLIATALTGIIENSETALAYLGPDKYTEALASSVIFKTVMSDPDFDEATKTEKSNTINEVVRFAVERYYDKIISVKIKSFFESISK